MEKFAVIGLGRFGMRLATLLSQAGAEVIAVDRRKDRIDEVRDNVTLAVCLDSTNEQALRAQGIDAVDVAVVGIGTDFEASALTTVILRQLGVQRIISRATSTTRGQILGRIGATDIVNPERESAERWRNRLLLPSIMERIELMEGYSLAQVAAHKSFYGKTLESLAIRKKYRVNIVAIKRIVSGAEKNGKKGPGQAVISVPMADTVIEPGDILLVIGEDEAIASLPRGAVSAEGDPAH